MPSPASKLDALRIGRSEIVNHHLDELAAGRLSRREFMRRGAALGMSSAFVAAALAASRGANN
jgi:peptide/nickel transport system substrate-binding protein